MRMSSRFATSSALTSIGSATETSHNFEVYILSAVALLSKQQTTMALIRLRECAG